MALRTPHTAILDAGLATHEARLLGHVGSSAVFVKTTLKKKIETSLFMVCVILNGTLKKYGLKSFIAHIRRLRA